MTTDCFISIDWGTSNVRIRLVQQPSLNILEEFAVSVGIKRMYDEWQKEGGSREAFFLRYLNKQIKRFKHPLYSSYQVVISGMASASIGLRELPYADLPFHADGSGLYFENIQTEIVPHLIVLISGVRSDSDVMRGEEVQLIGLINEGDKVGKSMFILPGTHSKHILCKDGVMVNFNTYMTGEIFQVMSRHSILKNSIAKGDLKGSELAAFDEGISRSLKQLSILNELFSVRAYDLFKSKTKTENYYYLSGLLIGNELKTLLQQDFGKLKLCAGGNLFELYFRAVKKINLPVKAEVISKAEVDMAAVKGQWRLLQNIT